MILAWLAACEPPAGPDSADPPDTEEAAAPFDCGDDADAPALVSTWTQAGIVPAAGLFGFASNGTYPVHVVSHTTGEWRADQDDLSWRGLAVGVTHTLAELAMNPFDPSDLLRSSGGMLNRSRDHGETWVATPFGQGEFPGATYAVARAPYDPDRVYAVLHTGGTGFSDDGGTTFTHTTDAPASQTESLHSFSGWRLLGPPAPGGRLLFGDGHGVLASDDEMATWSTLLTAESPGVSLVRDPADPDRVRLGGWTSEDGGDTWVDDGQVGVRAAAWGERLVLLTAESVLVSEDGVTFTERAVSAEDPRGVALVGERIFVADARGVVVSDDGGSTWSRADAGLDDDAMSVVEAHPACPARLMVGSRCTGGLYLSGDYGLGRS